jgi:2-polyprenyl-6-methoxyphenol hydroxylase-like FAD-dependent oxidoreductase
MSDPIAIVGAGPVGLMLAVELGASGVDAVVLERLPEPRLASLGMAINGTVVELLTVRGIMDDLREEGVEWPAAHFAHIPLDPARISGRHTNNMLVPQAIVERHIAARAAALGVPIRRGCEVTGIGQHADHVTVRTRSGAGEEELRCAYVVGCDGADSTVRRLAGIDFPGTESPFYGITGDIEATPELFGHLGAHQHPAGLFTVAPSGPGILRVSTGESGVAPPDPAAPVTLDELRGHVKALTGTAPEFGEPRWLSRWYHVRRQAQRYRSNRVFLAGDAAHVNFPLGGQSLSTGIEDAVNLGWKLAAAVRGWAPRGLLDTYHEERHPVGARAGLTTEAQAALMHPADRVAPLRALFQDLVGLAEVNEYLVRMAGGYDTCYPLPAGSRPHPHPLTGHRLAPDIPLDTAAGRTSVASVLSAARGVLLDLSPDARAAGETRSWADLVDVVIAERTDEIDATALLLRPDGRIAWATRDGCDVSGLLTALTDWFGAPV